MSEYQCENCQKPIKQKDKICPHCNYPQLGDKTEKIRYNTKLMKVKDLVEDSDKSIKGILSVAIIFGFMTLVVFLFSLLFNENHYANAITYLGCAIVYYLLSIAGKKSSYFMASLAVLFYIGHTIFEFSSGMYMKSPVPLDSFTETKGTALFFLAIPMAYALFRLALAIVLIKYVLTEIKLKRMGKMTEFVRTQ